VARGGQHVIRVSSEAYEKILAYAARHRIPVYQAASELIAAAKIEPQPEAKGGVMAEMAKLKEINLEEAKHVRPEPKPKPEPRPEPAPDPAGGGDAGDGTRPEGGEPAGDDAAWWED